MDEYPEFEEYPEDYPDDLEDPGPSRKKPKITGNYYRAEDYSLDSPIILDNLEKVVNKSCESKPVADLRIEGLRLLNNLLTDVKVEPCQIHSKVFEFINQKKTDWPLNASSNHLSKLLKMGKEYFKTTPSTKNVTKSFFSGLHQGLTNNIDLLESFQNKIQSQFEDKGSDIAFWWVLYHSWRVIVLLVNQINDKECVSIKDYAKSIGMSVELYKDHLKFGLKIYRVKVPILGLIYVNKSGCLLSNLLTLIDKNLLLMFQDMSLNRFNTLLLLCYPDERYSSTLRSDVGELYKRGDELIVKFGNQAYDIIKMIEPVCNNLVKTFAEQDSPVIPLGDFQTYLDMELHKLSSQTAGLSDRFFAVLNRAKSHFDAVFMFGLYRHWGHPYIEYFEGLKQLHEKTHAHKEVDNDYVNCLASDLARKLIRHYFMKEGKWPVDPSKLDDEHIFKKHVIDSTWPNHHEENAFGDNWHLIPFNKIFDTPTSISYSSIIDDKSHSLSRRKLHAAIKEGHIGRTQDRKVLNTILRSSQLNVIDFLNKIDRDGLDDDDLVIGLRAKERELKRIGRFFALMTLNLRYYFVITEMLIAKHILPLFGSLTMMDDLNKVFKKMVKCVPGHGDQSLNHVTYAIHIDYDKWNNHQRYESTAPIFKVMDKAFGLSNTITRTHEFFQNSQIYFADRPDLMYIHEGKIYNRTTDMVCWNGQLGGLEGLRQKGWSIISLLMIERESKNRNPRVRTLAQGDNQVICPTYYIPPGLDPESLNAELINISRNCQALMTGIYEGASKLGLMIKPDESWISHSYLIYGKFALVNRNLVCSEGKRVSRINVVSNDLTQTLGNTLSSVATTCITVCQQSDNIIKPIFLYIVFGSWVIRSVLHFDLGASRQILPLKDIYDLNYPLTRMLFLDCALGGIGGTSLTRFLVRQFPDSLTESLVFWKTVHNNTDDPLIRQLCIESGHPEIKRFDQEDIMKLIESPDSLNLTTITNPLTLIKNEVRKQLMERAGEFRNLTIKECLLFSRSNRPSFLSYLRSIKPCFPRFLSNLYTATIFGFTDQIVGLIQNTRTSRLLFTPNFNVQLCDKLLNLEEAHVTFGLRKISTNYKMWECSSSHADKLRKLSWGNIVGSTVPHPVEMFEISCRETCEHSHTLNNYMTCFTKVPPLWSVQKYAGTRYPYLGSATSDLTQLYKAWEKKSDHVLLKKALDLRTCLGWFIEPGSTLHMTLVENLQSLTNGKANDIMTPGPTRSGSYIHRYQTAFSSKGGFSAINHNMVQHMVVTTDTMSSLSEINWDFMYQSCILNFQTILTGLPTEDLYSQYYHSHIKCNNCLRPVKEDKIDSLIVYKNFPRLKASNNLYVDEEQNPFVIDQLHFSGFPKIEIDEFQSNISWEIGSLQGFIFVLYEKYKDKIEEMSALFPKVVFDNTDPAHYLNGFLCGLVRGCVIESMDHQFVYSIRDRKQNIIGRIYKAIGKIAHTLALNSMLSSVRYTTFLSDHSSVYSANYPLKDDQFLLLLKSFLEIKFLHYGRGIVREVSMLSRIILFPETSTSSLSGGYILSVPLVKNLLYLENSGRDEIRRLKELLRIAHSRSPEELQGLIQKLQSLGIKIMMCDAEIRYLSSRYPYVPKPHILKRTKYDEYEGHVNVVEINVTPVVGGKFIWPKLNLKSPRQSPLIRGLRLVRLQTGAHYKLKCILGSLKIHTNHALCLADYSGGFSSLILRKFPTARVIFNSLLILEDYPSGGYHPPPPAAILRLSSQEQDRCLNLHNVWENPSDLRVDETWAYLMGVADPKDIDLVTYDGSTNDISDDIHIVNHLCSYLNRMHPNVKVIFKVHLEKIEGTDGELINILCSTFRNISAATTEFTGEFSSEVYFICSHLNRIKVNRIIDKGSVGKLGWLNNANHSEDHEFERALRVNSSETIRGSLLRLTVPPLQQLLALTQCLGVSPAIAITIMEVFEANRDLNHFVASCLFCLLYIGKELNRVTDLKIGLIKGIPIPSGAFFNIYIQMVMGISFYLIYILRNKIAYSKLCNKSHIVIYYDVKEHVKRSKLHWSFNDISSHSKTINLKPLSYLQHNWVRYFETIRIQRQIQGGTVDISYVLFKLNALFQKFKHAYFNPSFFKICTGLFDQIDDIIPNFTPLLLSENTNASECLTSTPLTRPMGLLGSELITASESEEIDSDV
nr:L protein [Himastelon rhabdovirus 1]